MLKVLKFGGSSMADAHQFAKVKAIVDSDPSRRVVVVSAAGKRSRDDHKLTDLLYLCYAHLQYGVSCDAVFDMIRSRYLSIRDELHLSTPLEAEFAALREKMDRGISQDELVSRGEYFAARLMADPKIVQDPRPIERITYAELRELSYIGAQVLHEGTVSPVREKNIPLNIRNTNQPDHPGTMIRERFDEPELADENLITGIAGRKDFSVITITKNGMSSQAGVLRQILEVLERYGINVDYLPSGIDTVSLVVSAQKVAPCLYPMLGDLQKELKPDSIHVTDNMAIVAAVGRKMAYKPGTSGRIFAKLGENGINIRMITQGPEELNIIVGVDGGDFERAIRVLYDSFVK